MQERNPIDPGSLQIRFPYEMFDENENITQIRCEGLHLESLDFLQKLDLSQLTLLNVNRNNLPKIPEFLEKCQKLQFLSWVENSLMEIPGNSGLWSHIVFFDCSENPRLHTFPSFSSKNTIEIFRSNQTGITEIPDQISVLHCLSELYLEKNQIQTITSNLWTLPRLKVVDLTNNSLDILPEIAQTSPIQRLYLSQNRLKFLPNNLGYLSQLSVLQVSFNELHQLPPSFGQLTALKSFSCANNHLQHLPESITNLTQLRDLDLSFNLLRAIPHSNSIFNHLNSLNLDNTLIEDFSFCEACPNLTDLRLNHLHLKDLPNTLIHTSLKDSLKCLFLQDNEFHEIPRSLREMLCRDPPVEIYLDGNPFSTEIYHFLQLLCWFELNHAQKQDLIHILDDEDNKLDSIFKRTLMEFLNYGDRFLENLHKKIEQNGILDWIDFIHPEIFFHKSTILNWCKQANTPASRQIRTWLEKHSDYTRLFILPSVFLQDPKVNITDNIL